MLPHLSRICLESAEERARERRAAPRLLVLQVDVGPFPAGRLADPIGPRAELRLGVVGTPEAEVAERGGRHGWGREVLAVRDAEGGPASREELVRLVGEPAHVPELE